MEKKVKLTENELKTMIAEAICKILKEGQNDNPSNTHYAVHKPSNTIVFSWDYSGYDGAELKQYANDYFKQDLIEMGMNPKEITILTRKSCTKRGIDPTDDSCWSNYPLTESILNEYKSSKRGYSTTTVDVDLFDIEFPEPLNEFIENNTIPDTIEVEISYLYNEYTPATYLQPAEGGDFEYYCSDILTQPFENIIPQEMMQTFIDAVGEYTDNNIDDLFERANIDEDDYGPDPDEAYERWRDSRYED